MAGYCDELTALMLGSKASQDAELFCALAMISDRVTELGRERDAYRTSCHAAAKEDHDGQG